jgi:sugar lactone lactonase YvrE
MKPARWMGAAAALLLSYLAFAPTEVVPAVWHAPEDRGLSGPFASNGLLSAARVLAPSLQGPEGLAVGADGAIYAGTHNGEVARVAPDGRVDIIARTFGRPLGLKMLDPSTLLVADAYRGLLRVSLDGKVQVLVSSFEGAPLRFTDDLDLTPRHSVVFTDATSRFDLASYLLDALEHRPSGRLLEHDLVTGTTRLLKPGLFFANGVAVAGDGSYALVNETWAYRVRRVFLTGERAGQTEVVIDNLPGFPDNITYDRARDAFWIALASPRDPGLDLLAPLPSLRKVVSRLPRALHPKPQHHAMALAIRGNGSFVRFLDDPGANAYAPVTSVLAHGSELLLGSLSARGIARVAVPD